MPGKNTNTEATDLGISFGGQPPVAERESRYHPIYRAIKAKPGEWANVTKAVAKVNEGRDKETNLSAVATTFRNNDFVAKERQGELWVMWPTQAETES